MLKEKVTFISGASSGIGMDCAITFAEAGSDLILIARRIERLDELKNLIKSQYDVNIHIAKCDVRNFEECESVISNLPDDFQKIDILINNAGLASGFSKINEGELDDWNTMIDTNIKGLLHITKLILPQMVERGEGHIINIASIAATQVYPFGNVYCATKSAVKTLSQAMIIDLNGTGVRVSNIDPGLVETEFAEVRFHGDKERAKTIYKGYTPLTGRDVAEACLFVATRPKHVTIQDLMITPTDQATTLIINKK